MPTKNNDVPDSFVADPDVAKELGISLMTLWRYDRSEELRDIFPAKVQIGKRNYRSRRQLEVFKATMLRKALAERKRLAEEPHAA
jgi:predicted DNA-binding transcriptional regulator AlpA